MLDFRDRRVCITGSSYGIGFELVRLLLAEGAVVYSIARSPSPLTDPRLHHIQADLSVSIPDLTAIDFDLIVMNVGYNPGQTAYDRLPFSEVSRTVRLNVLVHLEFISRVRHKKVAFIDSVASMIGMPGHSLYCASKAFISVFCEALAREGRDTYIVYPYKVNTGFFTDVEDFLTVDKKYLAEVIVGDLKRGVRRRTVPWIFCLLPFLRSFLPGFVTEFFLGLTMKWLFTSR